MFLVPKSSTGLQVGAEGRMSEVDGLLLGEKPKNPIPTKNTTRNTLREGLRNEQGDGNIGICGYILQFICLLFVIVTCPISIWFCISEVKEYERAVIFRLGRLVPGEPKGPGLFFYIPCLDTFNKVDLRTVSFDVPPQEVLTRDSVTVSVDAVVFYRILNPTMSIVNIDNLKPSIYMLASSTLRDNMGTKNLAEVLGDKEHVSKEMLDSLDEATEPWGVKVERVEIKDVRLPMQLQRAMAAEAEAAREAKAKFVAAEGEEKASRALKDAADVMAKSAGALQLRYLQTLSTIAAEKNSTIIFPLPMELLEAFTKKGGIW